MTLLEMLTGALTLLERGTDAQTVEAWRDKLTRYLNDAILDMANTLQPRRSEEVTLASGEIDLSRLARGCVKVLKLVRGGRRYAFYYGAGTGKLHVPGVADGAMTLTYRYVPAALAVDTDVPDLPVFCHGALIQYAVARERAMGDHASISSARACFDLYLAAKRSLCAHAGEADAYRIENKFGGEG